MEYVGCPYAFDGRPQRLDFAYVTREEVDRRPLAGFENQIQTMIVFFQVIDPDLLPGVGELLGHPRTDAAVAASHQHAHVVVSIANRTRWVVSI